MASACRTGSRTGEAPLSLIVTAGGQGHHDQRSRRMDTRCILAHPAAWDAPIPPLQRMDGRAGMMGMVARRSNQGRVVVRSLDSQGWVTLSRSGQAGGVMV